MSQVVEDEFKKFIAGQALLGIPSDMSTMATRFKYFKAGFNFAVTKLTEPKDLFELKRERNLDCYLGFTD